MKFVNLNFTLKLLFFHFLIFHYNCQDVVEDITFHNSNSFSDNISTINELNCSITNFHCKWEGIANWRFQKLSGDDSLQINGPPGPMTSLVAIVSNKPVHLTSPTFSIKSDSCLQFVYYLMIDHPKESFFYLSLIDNDSNSIESIWMAGADYVDKWRDVQIDLFKDKMKPNNHYKLQFKVNSTSVQYNGYVALEKIRLQENQSCRREATCTFDAGDCGWQAKNKMNVSYGFLIAQGELFKLNDHTTHSSFGSMIYLPPTNPPFITSLLISPQYNLNTIQCFSFWFYQQHKVQGIQMKLIGVPKNDKEKILWQNNLNEIANEWIYTAVTIPFANYDHIYFMANNNDSSSSIAIDDITLTPFQCSNKIDCRFDDNVCGWLNEESNTANAVWSLGIGRVYQSSKLNFNSLPHLGLNTFLYTDFTTIPNGDQTTMELKSEFLPPPSIMGGCFQLQQYVNKFNKEHDEFQLLAVDLDGNQKILWRYDSHNDDQVDIFVPASISNKPFRFVLHASSSDPSTYITVHQVNYQDSPYPCKLSQSTSSKPSTIMPTVSLNQTLNCDFEKGFGNWKSVDNNFKIGNTHNNVAPEEIKIDMPFADHTTSSIKGNFAYVASKESVEAILMGANPFQGRTICISFAYYFYTTSQSTFTFTTDLKNLSGILFQAYVANRNRWQMASFTLMNNSASNFYFHAQIMDGALAIDDIVIQLGECPLDKGNNRMECTFERNSTCVFQPEYEGGHIYWQVYKADNIKLSDSNGNDVLLVDHTTHQSIGHFYGLNLDDPSLKTASASVAEFIVQSKRFDSSSGCLTFAYFLSNLTPDVSLFYKIEMTGNDDIADDLYKQITWRTNKETDGLWFIHEQPIISVQSFSIKFGIREKIGGSRAGTTHGLIFIDDVQIQSDRSCAYQPEHCDFENGDTCQMEAVPKMNPNDFVPDSMKRAMTSVQINGVVINSWLLGGIDSIWQVYTPLQNSMSFVTVDYTTQTKNGNYLLLHTHSKVSRGIIITQQYFMANRPFLCLSFALIKPSTESILEIYQAESKLPSKATKVGAINQSIENWKIFNLQLKPMNNSNDMFFYFVGTLFQSTAYMGIDDVQIIKGDCPNPFNIPSNPSTTIAPNSNDDFHCPHGSTVIPKSKLCDWVKDCPLGEDEHNCGNCDFNKHDLCNYEIVSDPTTDFGFNFSDLATETIPRDVSMTSSFLVAGGSWRGSTKLISPTIHELYNSIDCHFGFDYLYYRKEKNSKIKNIFSNNNLYLFLEFIDINERILLWQADWNEIEHGRWEHQTIPIERVHHAARLVFETTANSYDMVFHALDRFTLDDCAPKSSIVDPGFCLDRFICEDRKACISKEYVCDFEEDCDDGSDELRNCPTNMVTSFEFGLNNWSIQDKWKITWNDVSSPGNLVIKPAYDHTIRLSRGDYLYAFIDSMNTMKSVFAEATSPAFKVSTRTCHFTMQFLKRGSNDAMLLVVLRNLDTGEESILERLNIDRISWSHFRKEVTHPGTYAFILKAQLSRPSAEEGRFYVAIDDISFNGPDCQILVDYTPTTSSSRNEECPTIECPSKKNQTKRICLKEEQFCDNIVDCDDRRDETNCGACNFNDGFACRWIKVIGPADEKVILPAKKAPLPLPTLDGDLQSVGGYLAFQWPLVDKSPELIDHDIYTKIRSPLINAKTLSTCLFSFQMFSTRKSEVIVSIFSNDLMHILDSFNDESKRWITKEVNIGEQIPPFSIQMMVKNENFYQNWEAISLDNFELKNCLSGENHTVSMNSTLLTCDFEQDLCGWTRVKMYNDQEDNWLRTNDPHIEPGHDHTFMSINNGRSKGNWLTTQELQEKNEAIDLLVSTMSIDPVKTYCLTFWYYFFGLQVNYFSVARSPKSDSFINQTIIWARTIPEERNWRQGYIEILPQDQPYYVKFFAKVLPSTVVSVDDIVWSEGNCTVDNNEYCDFEINTCDWHRKGQIPTWVRMTADGAVFDHTTSTSNGHFMMNQKQGQKAAFEKKLDNMEYLQPTGGFFLPVQPICLQFYYYVAMPQTDKDNESFLSTMLTIDNETIIDQNILHVSNLANYQQLNQWNVYSESFLVSKHMSLSIHSLVATNDVQFMIDDVRILPHQCEEQGACDFEQDMCGWRNAHLIQKDKHTILWIRVKPSLQYFKDSSHLSFDHTTLTYNGNYLMLTTQMYKNGDSILMSPIIQRNTTTTICFRMFYFALMKQIDTVLQLHFIDLTTNGMNTKLITDIKGWNDMLWHELVQEFDDLPLAFAFKIVSNSSDYLISDIGIDDITINRGSCSSDSSPTTIAPPKEVDEFRCGFEKPCLWGYDEKAWLVTNWLNESGSKKNYYAPPVDHNKKWTTGNYLLFNGQEPMKSSYKISMTESLRYSPFTTYCFRLWYFEDGENEFTLSLNLEAGNSTILLNQFTSTLENRRWKPILADVLWDYSITAKKIKLSIVYRPSAKQYFSIFAIDDLEVMKGKCKHQHDFTNTFSNGLNNLHLLRIQPADDSKSKAAFVYNCSTKSIANVPAYDHTTYLPIGSYFLFKTPQDAQKLDIKYRYALYLDVPADDSASSSCFRFAYQYKDNISLGLKVMDKNSFAFDNIPAIWKPKFPKSSWTVVELNMKINYEHKFVFDMAMSSDVSSWLAIDDVTVFDDQCQQPINCDFENYRQCTYTPYEDKTTSSYAFGIQSVPSWDSNWPGPVFDHTTRYYGGSYLYLTAYRAKTFSNKIVAKLLSGERTLKSGQSYCLSLWYQMTTNDLSLALSILRYGKDWSNLNRTLKIYERSNKAPVKKWQQILITLTTDMLKMTEEVQLLMEGQVGANSKGILAIDDIVFSDNACPDPQFECEDGQKINNSQVCDFVKDCSNGFDELNCGHYCDFETDDCGWQNIDNDLVNIENSMKFKLVSASDVDNGKAPKFDADGKATGHYMLATKKKGLWLPAAELGLNYEIPEQHLKQSSKTCVLEFYYNVIDSVVNKNYNVQVRFGDTTRRTDSFYHIVPIASYNTGWRKAIAHVGEKFSPFFLEFNARLVDDGSMFAIDNVQMINCSFPSVKRVQNCPNSAQAMLCPNTGYCITKDELCDFKNDCGDEWDERQNCPTIVSGDDVVKNCNFEISQSACLIIIDLSVESNFIWQINNGHVVMVKFQPGIDSTMRTIYGHYFMMRPISDKKDRLNEATFYTPMMVSKDNNACRMRFFYYTDGELTNVTKINLNVYIRFANQLNKEKKPLLQLVGNADQRWTKAVVEYQSTKPFQFVFYGQQVDMDSRLAVDDITFDSTLCSPSKATPATNPTTTNPTDSNDKTMTTAMNEKATTESMIDNDRRHSSNNGLVAGIIVPTFLLLAAICGFFTYGHYRRLRSNRSDIILSMKVLQQNPR